MSKHQLPVDIVQSVVADLNSKNVRTKDALEKTFGITLFNDGQTSAFALFQIHDVKLRGLDVREISYREPLQDSGATAGSILIIRLNPDPCIGRDDMLRAFPAVKIGSPPSPEDPDPIQYFSQETSLTSLHFGFPLYGEACLKEIIFSLKQP